MTRSPSSPIAIVGVAALFPGSIDNEGFWRDIVMGKDLITDVPARHWLIEDYYDADPKARDKTYAKRGAFLPEVDFDALAWGVPPSIVPGTDTTQLLALIVAQRVLEDALGTRWKEVSRDRVSVILGVTSAQDLLGSMVSRLQRPVWRKALREIGLPESTVDKACDQIASQYVEWQESTFPGLLGNVVAGRIANRLDLGGTNCITDAACASSFSALQMAVSELRLGESDLVITGGADTMNDIFMYVCFSKTPALSPTGDCRPFSDQADGTMLGEGIGMVALKRLEDAERDGDKIYAVLAGVGSSSDGRSKSVYAPVASGQAKALRRAYAQAGYGPDTVGLMEAHGTGTRAGDAAEFEALRTVFDESGRAERGWCALGTVKSQVGHTKAASGAAGLFKAVMALHHGVLPPTIKVERPDPKLCIDESPFHLNTVARPWVRGAHPRRASVSSFGFGGSNFHVTLEEYTGASKPGRIRPGGGEVVLLSAATPAELASECRALATDAPRAGMLAYLARSTQEAFDASLPDRVSVYAETDAELADKLVQAAALVDKGDDVVVPGGLEYAHGEADERVAFLFPGQGSQYVGMGADVTMALPVAQRSWDDSAKVALDETRLEDVVFPRPVFDEAARTAQQARLTATEWAQPALAATSLAHLAVLRSLGVTPTVLAGHSFGELTALHAAGVMTAEALLQLARKRGELMREAARVPGSMISVAASEAELPALRDVVVANYNSPRQLVLSGATEAIEAAQRALAEAGLAATRLDVATAFHSPLVTPAVAPLRAFLSSIEVSSPIADVYANASAEPYPGEPDAIRDRIASQLAAPVRFVEQVEAMYARGIRTFVEVGAGRVLTNLVGHILKKRPHRAIALDRKGRPGLATLSQALGSLSVAGVPLAYRALWSDFVRTEDPRTVEKPKMTMKLSGANHGKLYPPVGGAAALPPPNPEVEAPVVAAAVVAATGVAAPAAPVADASVQLAWVAAFQETQRQTAEAHAAYQRSTAEVHAAFLRSADASLAGLAQMLGATLPATAMSAALAVNTPTTSALPAPLLSALMPAAPTRLPAAPTRLPAAATKNVAAPVAPTAPAASVPMGLEALSTLMVAIVAEKTGYPAETIGLDLDLEADLGVDSIKRVEILSATTERAPGLPKLNAAKMATLRTLREIVAHLREHLAEAPAPAAPRQALDPAALGKLMLAVVAEKTGYPPETIGLDLDLEADLGVDSIKRVEILSATTERAPGLPKLDAAKMATLRTLRQIVAYLENADPTPATHAPVIATSPITRSVVRAVPTSALGLATPGLLGARRLVVTDEGTGVAPALVALLVERGCNAAVVEAVPPDADAVVLLHGLADGHDPASATSASREAFRAARTIARRFTDEGGTLVSVQDTGGDFGLSGSERAWLAAPSALARTAALEWPRATVRSLDVERGARPPGDVARAILAELLDGGLELAVGLRANGERITLTLTEGAVADGPVRVDPRSVVVASGGARGVTAACLVALAKSSRCRIALLGRTAPGLDPCAGVPDERLKTALLELAKARGETIAPLELARRADQVRANREIERNVAAIRAAGGEARYIAVDVADREAVSVALEEVRKAWGPITGVVHGAGVLADKLLVDKRDEQWERVYTTKVSGLEALLSATRDDELAFVVLFSSVAAVHGNPGQSDYAMANEVLDKVAALEQARRPRALVRSIAWGPWDGGMVDDGLRARFAERGVSLLSIEEGTRRFLEELRGGGTETEVVIGAGRLAASSPRDLVAEVVVSRETYPYLDAHRVDGAVVVPVALVLEWFARAAYAFHPELHLGAIRDLKVLRGIRPTGFDGRGDRYVVTAHQIANGSDATLALELSAPDGRKHYAAVCELRRARPTATKTWSEPVALVPFARELYDGTTLFHGAAFHAIERIEGTTPTMVSARLVGARARAWTGAFELDPLLLDAGLQLALVWTEQQLGSAGLPTSIGNVVVHTRGPVHGRVRALLTGGASTADRTTSSVAFHDESGALVAELSGIEVHLLPRPQPASSPTRP